MARLRASERLGGITWWLCLGMAAWLFIPCSEAADELHLGTGTRYLRPGASLTLPMDALNLSQRVNGCQAMLGYSTTYFADPSGGCVAAGGGPWDLVIWDSWFDGPGGASGEIDAAIGIDVLGAVGTDADGTVAFITLSVRSDSPDGITHVVFRSDGSDVESTFFSDMDGLPVWPDKSDSPDIVIDGTPPVVSIDSATQGGVELLQSLGSTGTAAQGSVTIVVTASDATAGLVGAPTVTAIDSEATPLAVVFDTESPAGTFRYDLGPIGTGAANGIASLSVVATDRCGNLSSDADAFEIDKNRITGQVEFDTLSGDVYTVSRDTVFVASDSADAVLKTWTATLSYVNNTTAERARASFALDRAPAGTAHLSAKTAWTLRRRIDCVLDADGQATAAFTDADRMACGDLDGSNSVTLSDYSILKSHWLTTDAVSDISGDGETGLADYSLLKTSWFTSGDLP